MIGTRNRLHPYRMKKYVKYIFVHFVEGGVGCEEKDSHSHAVLVQYNHCIYYCIYITCIC